MVGDIAIPDEEAPLQRLAVLLRMWVIGIVLRIFEVPRMHTNTPILLHPRKPNQAFAAFKKAKSRAMLVGWMDKSHFVAEDREGLLSQVPYVLFGKVPLFILQTFVAMRNGTTFLAKASLVVTITFLLLKLMEFRTYRIHL